MERLERRHAPPWVPDPELAVATSALCKDVDAYRREIDGLPPDPANELTDEELAFERRATRGFLPYLLAQREIAHPNDCEHLDHWIAEIEAEIAKLDEETALESRPKAGAAKR